VKRSSSTSIISSDSARRAELIETSNIRLTFRLAKIVSDARYGYYLGDQESHDRESRSLISFNIVIAIRLIYFRRILRGYFARTRVGATNAALVKESSSMEKLSENATKRLKFFARVRCTRET